MNHLIEECERQKVKTLVSQVGCLTDHFCWKVKNIQTSIERKLSQVKYEKAIRLLSVPLI